MGTDDDRGEERGPGPGGFPGGSARLPRLHGAPPEPAGVAARADEPPVVFVTGGFVEDELTRARRSRRGREGDPGTAGSGRRRGTGEPAVTDEPTYASFSDYSPTESLFFHPAGRGGDDPEHRSHRPDPAEDGPPTPYAVLGVAPDATWTQVKSAHRSLLAELHPDRFVTATDAARRAAAERLAEVNLAFHTLDKERRAS